MKIKQLLISTYFLGVNTSFPFWSMGKILINCMHFEEVPLLRKNERYIYEKKFILLESHTQLKLITSLPKSIFREYIQCCKEYISSSSPINHAKSIDRYVSNEYDLFDELLFKLKFLDCNFEYNSAFWEENNLEEIKKNLYWDKHNSFFISEGQVRTETNCVPRMIKLNLCKEFESWSGVKVNNKNDKVILSLDNGSTKKKVNLDTALKLYWREKLESSIDNLSKILSIYFILYPNRETPFVGKKLVEDATIQRDKVPLDWSDLYCLENSTILALWWLFPDNDKSPSMENQMIGLAKDNTNNKLFHWTTDLGEDISVLMRYTKKIKKDKNPTKKLKIR